MNSAAGDPIGPGFPIRTSADQSSLAAPHGFSQRVTSFIASVRQGIHQMLFKRLIQQNPSHADPKRKNQACLKNKLACQKIHAPCPCKHPTRTPQKQATDFICSKRPWTMPDKRQAARLAPRPQNTPSCRQNPRPDDRPLPRPRPILHPIHNVKQPGRHMWPTGQGPKPQCRRSRQHPPKGRPTRFFQNPTQ